MSKFPRPSPKRPPIQEDTTGLLRNARGGNAPVLERVTAHGTLRSLMLDMHIEQQYRNSGSENIEVIYTFPLAHAAVLLGLEVEINGKKLTGMAVERKAAEHRYEEAMAEGNSAIMLEKSGDGLFTVNLGNLMPGEHAVIRYRYVQLLTFIQGNLRLALPTVIAPRYGNAERQANMRAAAVPGTDLLASYPFDITLDIAPTLSSCPISSPSHAIAIQKQEDGGLRVTLQQRGFLDRDFILAIDNVPMKSTVVLARDGENTVAMASLCPPLQPAKNGCRAPLLLKILVDCSGSMAGDSITAAKRALHRILASLQPGDRVTYSRFGSRTEHDVDVPLLIDADGVSLRALADYVGRTDTNLGGTETCAALKEVFALGKKEAAAVLLITDGETWDMDSILRAAQSAGQRIFSVGIGAAPAASLLNRLGEVTGGASEFIAPSEQVEGSVLRLFSRLRAPRVQNVSVAWPQSPAISGTVPATLFEGETLHLFASFQNAPTGELMLQWQEDNQPELHSLKAACAGELQLDDTLARLFAAKRVDELALAGDAAAAGALAEKYQLVSDYTNYLVVHERTAEEKATDLPELRQVDHMLAAGWGGMGSVYAEPDRFALRFSKKLISADYSGIKVCRSSPVPMHVEDDVFDFPYKSAELLTLGSSTPAIDPENLFKKFSLIVKFGKDLPTRINELKKVLPTALHDALTTLEATFGEQKAVAMIYAALLVLAKKERVDRTLLRHLMRLAGSFTEEDLENAGLEDLMRGNWN